LNDVATRRRIPILVELGVAGGRTGARTLETALAVAEHVLGSRVLEFAGVECYEGVLEETAPIDAFLRRLRTLVGSLAKRGRLGERAELIISAGGSEAFDRVVKLLDTGFADVPTRVVLRSGCYLTHDDGVYEERSPLGGRRSGGSAHLHAALEAWGVILSRPEPGLALAGMGKRDVPFDEGFPIPLHVQDRTGLRSVKGKMQVSALNDQHAFLHVPADDPLAVGDLIGCGISHPCTAFDKWRLIAVVDDDYVLIDAVHTFF
jgi:D-serine deaminase-like pyridoxal phosphate-dependent protein